MKKRTRFLAVLTCAALCLALAGCSQTKEETTPAKNETNATANETPANETAAAGLVVLDDSLAAEEYGVAFRKGDATRDVVNAAFQVLKANGTLAEISNKWFGSDLTTVTGNEKALDGVDTQDGRTLILGLDDSFPPMGYRDDNNEIVGFDIDVATAVCKLLNWTLKLQPIDWNAKEMELNSGTIDCIWNGMTLTEERLETMDCTDPYMANKQVLVVRGDAGITSKADLSGKKLALQTGSSAEDALNNDETFKASLKEVVTFDNNLNCFMDLEQGSVDAVLVDSIVAGWYIATGNL